MIRIKDDKLVNSKYEHTDIESVLDKQKSGSEIKRGI